MNEISPKMQNMTEICLKISKIAKYAIYKA